MVATSLVSQLVETGLGQVSLITIPVPDGFGDLAGRVVEFKQSLAGKGIVCPCLPEARTGKLKEYVFFQPACKGFIRECEVDAFRKKLDLASHPLLQAYYSLSLPASAPFPNGDSWVLGGLAHSFTFFVLKGEICVSSDRFHQHFWPADTWFGGARLRHN